MRRFQLDRLLSGVMIVCLSAIIISGIGTAAAIRTGLAPAFSLNLPLTDRQTLIIRNGPICIQGVPPLACNAGVMRREFIVTYFSPLAHEVLLAVRMSD